VADVISDVVKLERTAFAHPTSVTPDLTHSLDALAACGDMKITAAFGPQHGLALVDAEAEDYQRYGVAHPSRNCAAG
jgi:uncharacterized protein YbbC (DUF1343 family)